MKIGCLFRRENKEFKCSRRLKKENKSISLDRNIFSCTFLIGNFNHQKTSLIYYLKMKIKEIFCSVFHYLSLSLPLISFAIFRPVLNKEKNKPYKFPSLGQFKGLSFNYFAILIIMPCQTLIFVNLTLHCSLLILRVIERNVTLNVTVTWNHNQIEKSLNFTKIMYLSDSVTLKVPHSLKLP